MPSLPMICSGLIVFKNASVFAMRACNSAMVFSLSSNAGMSTSARRAAPPLALSQAIRIWLARGNWSKMRRSFKSASSKRSFEEALLNDRLIFDQFPLANQIRIACDNAKGGAARLAEVEIPAFEDNEKTIAELQARIAKTLAFLKTIKPEQIIGKEGIKVSLSYWDGKSLTGFEYATQYLIPNFRFHVVTAYAILRKNGVPIGKSDYIGVLPLK